MCCVFTAGDWVHYFTSTNFSQSLSTPIPRISTSDLVLFLCPLSFFLPPSMCLIAWAVITINSSLWGNHCLVTFWVYMHLHTLNVFIVFLFVSECLFLHLHIWRTALLYWIQARLVCAPHRLRLFPHQHHLCILFFTPALSLASLHIAPTFSSPTSRCARPAGSCSLVSDQFKSTLLRYTGWYFWSNTRTFRL